MCLATGEDTAQSLFEIAKKQYYTTGQKFPYDYKESLTVTDNRTGRHYEIPISYDAFDAKYLLEIKSQSGNSIAMRDPTLSSTVIYQSSMVRFDTECQVYRVDFGSILADHDLIDATYLLLSGEFPNGL
jgi:citrate synthase